MLQTEKLWTKPRFFTSYKCLVHNQTTKTSDCRAAQVIYTAKNGKEFTGKMTTVSIVKDGMVKVVKKKRFFI